MSVYPRYFRNTTTKDVYQFTSLTNAKLIKSHGGDFLPSDKTTRTLAPHTKHIWIEVRKPK